jgi:hypothetical protein
MREIFEHDDFYDEHEQSAEPYVPVDIPPIPDGELIEGKPGAWTTIGMSMAGFAIGASVAAGAVVVIKKKRKGTE